jgi:hypothetical protein
LHNHEEAQQHGLVQEDWTQTSSCETNFAAAEGTNKSDGTCLGLTCLGFVNIFNNRIFILNCSSRLSSWWVYTRNCWGFYTFSPKASKSFSPSACSVQLKVYDFYSCPQALSLWLPHISDKTLIWGHSKDF